MTRINFGLHNTSNGVLYSVETIAKVVGYNFLCAKRHFEHAFSENPEVFSNNQWQTTKSENVQGKAWHVFIGCLELIPVIGHVIAIAERFFAQSQPLPLNPVPNNSPPPSTKQTESPQINPAINSTQTDFPGHRELIPLFPEFAKKIIDSAKYTKDEKNFLLSECCRIYSPKTNYVKNGWLFEHDTLNFLNYLSNTYPNFRTLPKSHTSQFRDKDTPEQINDLVKNLPTVVDDNTPLFGHALQIGGNHRVAFLIDLKNKKIEYFDSKKNYTDATPFLDPLKKALSEKYEIEFGFINHSIYLQNDGFQCGVWTCKFIEERISKGTNFDINNLKGFDIVKYREKLFEKLVKYSFYLEIGTSRLTDYAETKYGKKNIDNLYLKIDTHFTGKNIKTSNFLRYYPYPDLKHLCKTGKLSQGLIDELDYIIYLCSF